MATTTMSSMPIQLVTKSASSLYDVHRILGRLNSTKTMVLNDTPRYLIGPGAFMPRNYATNDQVCQIQFSNSTAYPWSITLVGRDEAKTFPSFTPVTPEPDKPYEEMNYDETIVTLDTRGEPLYRQNENQQRLREQMSSEQARKQQLYRELLRESDYERQTRPDDIRQTESLHIPAHLQQNFTTSGTNANKNQHAKGPQGSLCNVGSRIVYQLASNTDEFYRPNINNEATPYSASNDVIQRYRRLIDESNNATPFVDSNNIPVVNVDAGAVAAAATAMDYEPSSLEQTQTQIQQQRPSSPPMQQQQPSYDNVFGGIASPPMNTNDVYIDEASTAGF